jgi:hypothetical protein
MPGNRNGKNLSPPRSYFITPLWEIKVDRGRFGVGSLHEKGYQGYPAGTWYILPIGQKLFWRVVCKNEVL